MKGLTKNDGDIIGFVFDCLYSGVIDKAELKEWAIHIVSKNDIDTIPSYIIDLMDFNGSLGTLYSIMGFSPGWKHTKKQGNALYGISVKRGRELYDAPVTSQEAVETLEQHPEIEERFRETFPFIDF
ncbi:hypothetical protein [Serratia fonticola]|uniref:hypothetical protein n=1 Tax=Serratia fonticola TaxID=47917 RepID=UPI00217A82CA|nr:hypothetical protein [Serratia fonticola]CAI1211115.1 Uncharacterised protein [Serratia fonticola]